MRLFAPRTSNLILGFSEGQNRVALHIYLKLLLINLHNLSYSFRVNLNKIIPLVCEASVSHSNVNIHIDRRFLNHFMDSGDLKWILQQKTLSFFYDHYTFIINR